jgi:hypothetical protein
MLGYILTEQQKDQIQGQEFAPFQSFNCVQDINGVWYLILSQQDIITIAPTSWVWVLTLPQAEYIPPPSPPFPPIA